MTDLAGVRTERSRVKWVMLACLSLTAVAVGAHVALTPEDFHVPGTQIGDVPPGTLASSDRCAACHGDFGQEVAPHDTWAGSLKAHAVRDPLFLAQLTTANQDTDNAGYFCLRCHAPQSIVSGHAYPVDGSALDEQDTDGINCTICHSMVDPIYEPGVSPLQDASILDALDSAPGHYGNAMFVLDPNGLRRGPRTDAAAPHTVIPSAFHRKGNLCGTCHDVGNVAVARRPDGTYWYNTVGERAEDSDPHSQFPLERTFSEWRLSDFANGGVDMAGRFGGAGSGVVSTCQDCHMPKTAGRAAASGPQRDDLARHDFAGASSWILEVLAEQYADDPSIDLAALAQGRDRAVAMLQKAASLELTREEDLLRVRVINETGHKLPTGHIEGRRVWVHLGFSDDNGTLLAEHGHYDYDTAHLDEASTVIYDMHVGLSQEAADLLDLPAGPTTHMALANVIEKDNRIPPRGFNNAAFEAAGAPVVGATYADGQYWDDTLFQIPAGATRASATVYYQTASREYIEALRDANYTDDRGETLFALWQATDKSAPVPMVSAEVSLGNTQLMVSTSPDRGAGRALSEAALSGAVYIYADVGSDVTRVHFYLDDPEMLGPPRKTENFIPYDFSGTRADMSAAPFSCDSIDAGAHDLTAMIEWSDGTTTALHAAFEVTHGEDPDPPQDPGAYQLWVSSSPERVEPVPLDAQTVSGSIFVFVLPQVEATGVSFYLDDPDLLAEPLQVERLAPFDFAGTMAAGQAAAFDTGPLAGAAHIISAVVRDAAGVLHTIHADFVVAESEACAEPPCGEALVQLPLHLDFATNHGHLVDVHGTGTGLTTFAPRADGAGYMPGHLTMLADDAALAIDTTSGLMYLGNNAQDNMLGVQLESPQEPLVISTSLLQLPVLSGRYEQAGLWFGMDQDNYVKLVVNSFPNEVRIEALVEVDGMLVETTYIPLHDVPAELTLRLEVHPADSALRAAFQSAGVTLPVGTLELPWSLVNPDSAWLAGLFASHRRAHDSLRFRFDHFAVTHGTLNDDVVSFDRSTHGVAMPTALAWGPDERLYVTELMGTIHALTYGPNLEVIDDEIITALSDLHGPRLTLGLAVDPLSTADDVVLWVAHSSPGMYDGLANSSIVSRLSGLQLDTVDDIITGLPRSKANHSVNGLHFGPDDRLYIAAGGNTGAGAANLAASEFGDMAEQPLSAALLVADVRDPQFIGTCHNPDDLFDTPPCDVHTFATGLRNVYDFAFHSNGHLYAPDNGLGVTGTYPPTPVAPCDAYGTPTAWTTGGHYPGIQPDTLLLLEEGMYYGHPNPSRGECVYMDGHYQGVEAAPNYAAPIFTLGDHTSSNGTIEYRSSAFCGALAGELLIANFSVGDNIVRVRLSEDGREVESFSVLADGFQDPLPLAQRPDGTIFVGEFGGSLVTALKPRESGCWQTREPMPHALLDAGGTAVDGLLYAVGGKDAWGYRSDLLIYDPADDSWAQGPVRPGPGFEDPSALGLEGRLYVFGGSTAPFSGATAQADVFNPHTNDWTALAAMPTARAGATAQTVDGRIFVIGGMNASGASLDVVEVYDLTLDLWRSASSMLKPRDNSVSAVVNGRIIVFGGRTRQADGTTLSGTLSSVEAYDVSSDTWTPLSPMPTGRRAILAETTGALVYVIGGESTPSGESFAHNEVYDVLSDSWRVLAPMPTARHGMVGGLIDGVIYAAGGGPQAGSSYSPVLEAFTPTTDP